MFGRHEKQSNAMNFDASSSSVNGINCLTIPRTISVLSKSRLKAFLVKTIGPSSTAFEGIFTFSIKVFQVRGRGEEATLFRLPVLSI